MGMESFHVEHAVEQRLSWVGRLADYLGWCGWFWEFHFPPACWWTCTHICQNCLDLSPRSSSHHRWLWNFIQSSILVQRESAYWCLVNLIRFNPRLISLKKFLSACQQMSLLRTLLQKPAFFPPCSSKNWTVLGLLSAAPNSAEKFEFPNNSKEFSTGKVINIPNLELLILPLLKNHQQEISSISHISNITSTQSTFCCKNRVFKIKVNFGVDSYCYLIVYSCRSDVSASKHLACCCQLWAGSLQNDLWPNYEKIQQLQEHLFA